LIDIGKDPARHPKATRAEFLELAKKHSAEIKLVSTEEAIEVATALSQKNTRAMKPIMKSDPKFLQTLS
jgi:hypothetical protein